MIKNPITNTGEVRYFEIFKIFLLLSFFYAFSSVLTDKNFLLVSQASVYLVLTLFGLLTLIMSIVVVQESISLFRLLKSFTIQFIQFRVVVVMKEITVVIHRLQELPLFINSHLRLCVVQC